MGKTVKPLSPESFESVCRNWEQDLKVWILQLSDGSIPALRGVEWFVEKRRIFVCEPDSDGKKKRGACGPYFSSYTILNRTTAGAVWKLFQQFSKAHGLSSLERLRNNEKELGRYDFRASNCDTNDELSCRIDLPGEWNKAGIHISMVVGPRYRNEDLSN